MIKKTIEELLCDKNIGNFKIQKSDRPDLCDYQSNDIFKISKLQNRNPIELGLEIESKINTLPEFNNYFKEVKFIKPGFLNIKVSDELINKEIKKIACNEKFNINMPEKIDTFVIDYGGANAAKPLHVGHMRSAILGESIKRIIKFYNNEVISDVHLGDYGLQIGQVIYGINKENILLENITINDLDRIYPEMSSLCKEDETVKKDCQQITKELQDGNEMYQKIWKKILQISIKDIKKNYDFLDVHFDYWYGESDAYKYIPQIENTLISKGLLRKSDGASVVDVKEETDKKEIPPLLFKKSDGAYLYPSTDLGCILQRVIDFSPQHIIYITDSRQGLHFEQVFRVASKIGLIERSKLEHLGYGTVNGQDGKPYKTRSGTAPKLENLFNDVKELFISKKEENKKLSDDDIDKIVNSILKYGDLQNSMEKDYIFNIDKFSDTVGKTGPYILYTYLRINKIINDNNYNDSILSNNIYNEVDRNLRIKLFDFEDYMTLSYVNRNPFYIADYTYELCLMLNNFYQNNHISNLENDENKNDWLYILSLSNKILKQLLNLLVIDIPTKM